MGLGCPVLDSVEAQVGFAGFGGLLPIGFRSPPPPPPIPSATKNTKQNRHVLPCKGNTGIVISCVERLL